jgi:hypothetical protein
MKRFVPVLAASALLSVLPVAARQPQPDAAAIIQKHVAARGGQAKFDALTSIKRVCRSDPFEFTGLWAGGKARFDQVETTGGSQMTSVADGAGGWTMFGGQAPSTLSADAALDLRNDVALGFELFVHRELGLAIAALPNEKVEGRDAHHLQLTRKTGAVADLFIDVETGLEIARKRTVFSPDGAGQQVYSAMRDYEAIDGVQFPGTIGACSAEWTVNAPVAATLFERPR